MYIYTIDDNITIMYYNYNNSNKIYIFFYNKIVCINNNHNNAPNYADDPLGSRVDEQRL